MASGNIHHVTGGSQVTNWAGNQGDQTVQFRLAYDMKTEPKLDGLGAGGWTPGSYSKVKSIGGPPPCQTGPDRLDTALETFREGNPKKARPHRAVRNLLKKLA